MFDLVDGMKPAIPSSCGDGEWLEGLMCGRYKKGGTVKGHRTVALSIDDFDGALVRYAAGDSGHSFAADTPHKTNWAGTITADWTFKVAR